MAIFTPRIAIAGGGPSGLALSRLLYQRGIPSTIYELRSKPTPAELAKPSGMLDLHVESGLAVMKECGLMEEFNAAVGDCSEHTKVFRTDGRLIHTDSGKLSFRPEIPRHSLTDILTRSLPEGVINWDHKIHSLRSQLDAKTGATEITLDLGAKGQQPYDLVIGSDGAWSKARKLLTPVTPSYANHQFLAATIRNVTTRYPHLLALNGSGVLYALGGGNGIMTHRGPQDSIRVYAAISTREEDWVGGIGMKGRTARELKERLLSDGKLYRDWAPELRELLGTACDEDTRDTPGAADVKPMYALPVGHRWKSQTGVTLIGDAAHLMTPWAGEGVNLALWDALDLSKAISGVSSVGSAAEWQAALKPRMEVFEEGMMERAKEKAEETVRNQGMMLGQDGAEEMVKMFQGAGY